MMKSTVRFLMLLILGCSLCAPGSARSAEEGPPRGRGRFERRWMRSMSEHATNNASVKAAFREAVADASAATVRILSDGKPAALGVVLDEEGHIVTKASDLLGTLTCRIAGRDDCPATLLSTDEAYDLAVLKTDVKGLKPAVWRTGDTAPPGSLIASVAPEDELLSVGVVSSGPRRVSGPTRLDRPRGWLGIGLGDGDTGLGITSVMRDSAADKAGILPGDRIVKIDGETMKGYERVIEIVGANPPGSTIHLVVAREGEELELSATLGKPENHPLPQDHWGGGPFSARRTGFPSVLPHDSVIRPSECGGPIVDTDGKIVGINIARALRVTTYAVPAGTVLEVSKKLLAASK